MRSYVIHIDKGGITFSLETDAEKSEIKSILTDWFLTERLNGNYRDVFEFIKDRGFNARCCDEPTDSYQVIYLYHLNSDNA